MSKKTILIIIGIAVVLFAGFAIYQINNVASAPTVADPKNATYVIEGEQVSLINGRAEKEVMEGSASKIITQYFGNEVTGDFNNDEKGDTAFLLTQQNGGSGTFYYIAALVSDGAIYKSTNSIFIGDRIAPQTTEFKNGNIVVNVADRKPGEPMTANPSVGVSYYFSVINNQLVKVKQ